MAFASVGTLGHVNDGSAGTTVVLTTSATAEAENLVVLWYGGDNLSSSADDADYGDVSSITDSAGGNTWTKMKENSNNNAGAGNGVTASVWYSVLTNQINSGGTITANLSGSPTVSNLSAWEFTKGGGTTIAVEQTAINSGDSADPAAISLAAMTSREYLLIWGFAGEQTTAGTFTPDADYTEIEKDSAGTGASAAMVWGGFRIATLTDDTVDAATGTDRDYTQVLGALYEVSAGVKPKTLLTLGVG